MRRIRTLAALAAVALAGVGSASAAHIDGRPTSATPEQAVGAVTALSVVPGEGRADVVIALTGPVKVVDFMIQGPDRIVLDLTGARLNALGRSYDRKQRGGIRNVRAAQNSPSIVRVVLDLDEKRTYTVAQSDTEIRVSVNGGERFVAWYSSGDKTVFASTPEVTKPAGDERRHRHGRTDGARGLTGRAARSARAQGAAAQTGRADRSAGAQGPAACVPAGRACAQRAGEVRAGSHGAVVSRPGGSSSCRR
jgi:hypothetical protein